MTRAWNEFGAMVTLVALCAFVAGAQEKISPLSDYQYKKDYAQCESILKEADLQKRADLLTAFQKEHPISKMLDYVALQYLECLKPYLQKKDWAKAISMEEAFLAIMPTEKTVQAAAIPVGVEEFTKKQLIPSQKAMYQALMAAYYQSGNLPKAAENAEKVYAVAPDKTGVATLADIYLRMQNYDKYLIYGEKILAEFPMDQAYGTALQMVQVYSQKQNGAKAMELLSKVVDAFPDKTPPGMKEEAWSAVRANYWNQKAAESYKQKDYPAAMDLFAKVIKIAPQNDEAYYYTGMCKWNSKDLDGAIEPFAKAAVLGKNFAKRAQDNLDQLWKARHPDNPAGIEEVKSKAKADLGIK
ncbi:MAG TPA: tetratricopeptide repeat protein [Acidobacteriota bacterium]|nr:tetratricopeptide repeat protein [Acidobacteriota bacterium]